MAGLAQYKEKFLALTKREQYILLGLVLVVVFFIWDQLFYAPLERDSKSIQQKINSLQSKISEVGNDSVVLLEASNHALMKVYRVLPKS